jgi:flagellar hook assembly protein FlgD
VGDYGKVLRTSNGGGTTYIDENYLNQNGNVIQWVIHQNSPNPFNPTTTINYSIASVSRVTLSIYNVLGEQIRSLESTVKQSGSYSVVWDSSDDRGNPVSSGIYIYRIDAIPVSQEDQKRFIDSKKMLLMR